MTVTDASAARNRSIERFNNTLKHEDLYRDLPIDGVKLTARVDAHRDLYNQIRPHEGIKFNRPPPSTRQSVRNP